MTLLNFVFGSALFENGELFAVAADTGKGLAFPVAAQLHALMANRAAGVRLFGDRFPMAALPVLADEHCAAFAVYFQHQFSAVRAMCSCDIVVLKLLIAAFDFSDRLLCVLLHFFNEG